MEDQNNEVGQPNPQEATPVVQPEPPSRRMPPLPIVLLLIIIGLIAWYVAGKKPAWDAASYLPKEAAIAITVDLSGNADKRAGEDFIMGVLKDAGLKDPEKQAYDALSKKLKIDVERDVVPLLNGKGGFAVGTEMAGMMPSMTAVVGAKSDGAATKLLDIIENKLKAEGAPYTTAKHQGCEYVKIMEGMTYLCVGAVGSGIVVTAGEEPFKKAVETHKGKSSLAQNEYYNKYKSSEGSNVLNVFYSGPGLYKLVGPFMAMGAASMGPNGPEQIQRALESATAVVCSVQLSGAGVKSEIKGLTTESSPELKAVSLDELVSGVPADAAFAYSLSNFDKLWARCKEQMAKMPTSAAQMAQIAAKVKAAIGVDIFKDVLEHVKSITLYYVPKPPITRDGFPGAALCILKVDDPAPIAAALAKAHASVPKLPGWTVKPASVSGQKAAVISGKNPGLIVDALVGDELLIGVTGAKAADAAKSVLDLLKIKGPGLSSTTEFQSVKAGLSAESWALMYGDVSKVIVAIQKTIEPASDRKKALAVTKKVGLFGATGAAKGKESEAVFFAPFVH